MRTTGTLVVTLAWLVACPGIVAPQVVVAPPPAPTAVGLETEGVVRRIDRAARSITLDTGEEYVIPPALDTAWSVLREGGAVRVRYNVDGGRSVASFITVIR